MSDENWRPPVGPVDPDHPECAAVVAEAPAGEHECRGAHHVCVHHPAERPGGHAEIVGHAGGLVFARLHRSVLSVFVSGGGHIRPVSSRMTMITSTTPTMPDGP